MDAEDIRLEMLLLDGLASDCLPLDDQFRANLAEKAERIVTKHLPLGTDGVCGEAEHD